jgi:hypothetical protein
MDTLIFLVLPLLALAMFALRQWSRQPAPDLPRLHSEMTSFDGLFAPQREEEARALARADAELQEEETRAQLLARACLGDETTLEEAHGTGNRVLYDEVLESLVAQAANDAEQLRSIAEYIVDGANLRATPAYAARMIELYQRKLDPRALADMLHLAALSDDAGIFERAVEAARARFRQGRIPGLQSRDLLATIESGYWLISAETRYSGAGFSLKQLIAGLRRELATATRLTA